MDDFAARLLTWWEEAGRHDLPWQSREGGREASVWRIWVSEVMLQQTQVVTVIPYFQRFMQRFPDVYAFARADENEVLTYWAGLGYYRRVRMLHAAAKQVVADHQGHFPRDLALAMRLPGLGRSTAGAILAQAFDLPQPILDGNVKRVLARYFAIEGWPGQGDVERALWQHAAALTPNVRAADYTQAIMDLGATLCTPRKPDCPSCPLQEQCLARLRGRQDELPQSRPRKVLPVKNTVMWLIRGEQGWLLQQRPALGIWPGLFSFPETSGEVPCDGVRAGEALPMMRHTFSHFHLDIHPRYAEIASAQRVADSSVLWYNPGHSRALAVPAPVRRLIDLYCKE